MHERKSATSARDDGCVPPAPADLTVAHGDLALAVRDHGGDGPPVLLLHGVGANLAHWALVGPRLRPRYRVLSVDLPAHGRSPVPERYSFADDVAAVHSVARALALQSPALVGHSYGGMLAVAAAAEQPDDYRVAVNVDGVGFPHAATPQRLLDTWDQEEGPEDSGPGNDGWLAEQVGRDEAMVTSFGVSAGDAAEPVRRSYRQTADGRWQVVPPAGYYHELLQALRGLDLLATYARCRCRTLTVVATQRYASAEAHDRLMTEHVRGVLAVLSRLPAADVAEVASGHLVPLEAPGRLAEVLRGVLD